MYGVLRKNLILLLSLVLLMNTLVVPVYASNDQIQVESKSVMETRNDYESRQLTKLRVGGKTMDLTTTSYWKLDINGYPTKANASKNDYEFKVENGELTLNLDGDTINGLSDDAFYYYGAAIYAEGDLNIAVESNSTVKGADNINYSSGIHIKDGGLTIKGDGTLTANGGNVTNGVSYGINVESYTRSVSVMVENSNIISKGGITDGIYLNVSYGIYAFSFYDSVLVTAIDGGSIYATGNNLEGEQSNSYGISAISNYGSVEIISRNGGSVKAIGGSTTNGSSYGINAESDSGTVIMVNDGNIEAQGGNAAKDSYGISAISDSGSVSVKSLDCGSIKAQSGRTEGKYDNSYGIYARSDSKYVEIISENGSIKAQGGIATNNDSYGIYTYSPSGNTKVIVTKNGRIDTQSEIATGGSYGISVCSKSANVSLTVTQGGSINAQSCNSGEYSDSCGIYMFSYSGHAEINVEYGSIKAHGGSTEGKHSNSYGILTKNSSGDIEVKAEHGSIEAQGSSAGNSSYGIFASSNSGNVKLMSIDKGSINAQSGSAKGEYSGSYGISAVSNSENLEVTANSGSIKAIGNNAEGEYSDSYGISLYSPYGNAAVNVREGGSIKAQGNIAKDIGYGIYVYGKSDNLKTIIDGSTLIAHGKTYGIYFNSLFTKSPGKTMLKNGAFVFTKGESEAVYNSLIYDTNSSGIMFENFNGSLYGEETTPWTDFEIPEGYVLSVEKNKCLNIQSGLTITNNGTLNIYNKDSLSGNGTLNGDGQFIIEYVYPQIIGPEKLIYTGGDLSGEICLNKVADVIAILGKDFDVEGILGEEFWTKTITKAGKLTEKIINPGEYTITYTFEGYSLSKTIIVEKKEEASLGDTYSDSSSSTYYNDIEVKDGDIFGTVTVMPKTAKKGEKVTINVEPKTGFEVDKVTVKDNNGNEIDVEKVSGTEYTFIQPGEPTDIYVSYVKAEQTEIPEEVEELQQDTLPFADVSNDAWYRKAVEYAYEKGIISGTGENTFSPNTDTTRGMIVSIIWRLENSPSVNYAMSFSDVDPSMYYSEAVRWALSQGIVKGYENNTFVGNDNISREQLAVMLYNYAKLKGYDTTQGGMAVREFADYENISDYAKEAVTWAVNAGIISGMGDGTLTPQGSATRAEAAQMLMVFCENII